MTFSPAQRRIQAEAYFERACTTRKRSDAEWFIQYSWLRLMEAENDL